MLQQIADVLIQPVLAGGAQIVEARRTGAIASTYKDATELVTGADQRSDAAMADIFASQLGGLIRRFPSDWKNRAFLEQKALIGWEQIRLMVRITSLRTARFTLSRRIM